MGILSIFKPKQRMKEVEPGIKPGIADELIDYVLGFIKDKERIKGLLKEINKIRKLPTEEQELAYLPAYLKLEQVIVGKKETLTKEYFSRKVLRKQKEFTKEDLRKAIREKFDVSKLSNKFKVLFLNEPEQSLVLYELLCQEFISLLPTTTRKKIISVVSTEHKNLLADIIVKKEILDFSAVNKKIKDFTIEDVTQLFKELFLTLYNKVVERSNKNSANEVVKNVYYFVEDYGYPLNAAALRILPIVSTKEAAAAVAHYVVKYASELIPRKDMIQPLVERMRDVEFLPVEEKEKAYFDIYLKLEKFITEHAPPAVQRKYTQEELRREINEAINVQYLNPKFKLLFLQEEEQVIELFIELYKFFVQKIFSVWSINDIQKFVNEQAKGAMRDVSVLEKEGMDFSLVKTKISDLSKEELRNVLQDLSSFLRILHKKVKEVAGEKKAEKAMSDAFNLVKEQYGMLPIFHDFIRAFPEGVLDYEQRILLSPKAAEEVVRYIIEILKKEKIEEHLKALEEARELPLEEQSEAFFNIYLNLQHYIVEQRPSIKRKEITLSDLKEKIRKHVNVKDLEDKFQLLFLAQDEILIKLVGDLIKECIANFIDKKALIEAERELFQKNQYLRNVEINEEGSIDFEPFFVKLKKIKADKVKVLNSTSSKVILVIYEKAKSILGELQAKKLFGTSYVNLQEKYGANLLQVLKVIPKGILESEKFELLGKEEIEKTAKEIVKIDVMKGEFMNIAAHELKTPLVPIISYLEMLLNDKRLARDQKEKIRICLSSAKREADLVGDILDISKLEAGSLKLEFETLDIVELLREATDGLEPAVKQKKLSFKTEIPSKLPFVKGDRRRITQVVTNLINNATKFTEKGGITVKAQTKGQEIVVSVADTGIGINKENTKKLFTKFFQVDTAARRKQGGTGLGLAICKGIVQGHKGKMWIESELGKGTTFFFTVPYLPTTAKETRKERSSFVNKETSKKFPVSQKSRKDFSGSQKPKVSVKTEKVKKETVKRKKKEKGKVRKVKKKKIKKITKI